MNTMDKISTTELKKKKAQGPIRTGVLVPLIILTVLFVTYFKFFFDNHLRRGLEYGGTQANGAEVNVSSLRTNFLEPSIVISRIQVTNKSDPAFNLIEIGKIKLHLSWDALLRGKFVIPESSVLKIQLASKRSRPGRVLPPKPKSNEKGMVTKAAEQTLNQLKQKNESNLLSDIFAIAGGTDYKDQLKKLEGQFKTQEKVKILEKELKAKEQEWKKRIDGLPNDSEIKQFVKKVESLKIDTKNPAAIQASIKQIDSVYKEAREKYKTVDEAKKAFDTDLKKYKSEYTELENMVKSDIDGIMQKLNIPSLDPQEINKMLLGNMVASQLGSLLKYKDLAREYMPTKTAAERKAEKEKDQITPAERAKGVNYSFAKNKSYPRFWLQKAQISSESSEGDAGDLIGTLQNVTDNPKHLGIPATFDFKGGFPKQKILAVMGNLTIDHTTDNEVEKGFISVGNFPVKENTLTKSKDVELGYKHADGSSKFEFQLQNKQLTLASNTLFSNVQYFVNAPDKNIHRILNGVIASLNNLDLNIRAQGSWDDISLNINSNLGEKLQAAILSQISGEIKRAREEVEKHVREVIGKETAKIQGEVAKLENQLGISLKSKEDAINSLQATIDKKKKDAIGGNKKEMENKVKTEGKKELNKLLKGIKF